jgi:hypothetical protein
MHDEPNDVSTPACLPCDICRRVDRRAGVAAGLAAGLVVVLVQGASAWGFAEDASARAWLRSAAAIALGPAIAAPHVVMTMQVTAAGLAVHAGLSALYGWVIGWLVHDAGQRAAPLLGLGFALLAIYPINFWLIAPAAFPWFETLAGPWAALVHSLFGAVTGFAYHRFRARQ